MRELCLPVPPQQATTQDNVRINLEGNVYVKILDPEKATYNVKNPLFAILRHAEAAMRSSVGLMELDNIFVSFIFVFFCHHYPSIHSSLKSIRGRL